MEYEFDERITIGKTGTVKSVPSVCRLDSTDEEVLRRVYFVLNVEPLSINAMHIYGTCQIEEGDLFEVDEGDGIQRIYTVDGGEELLIGLTSESQTWHEVYRKLLERALKVQQAIREENAKLTDNLEKYRSELRAVSGENTRLNDANLRLTLLKMDPRDKLHNLKTDHTTAIERLKKQAEATDDTEYKIESERIIAEHEQNINEITEILSYLKKYEPL